MISPYHKAIARNVMNVTKLAIPTSSSKSSMIYAMLSPLCCFKWRVLDCNVIKAESPITVRQRAWTKLYTVPAVLLAQAPGCMVCATVSICIAKRHSDRLYTLSHCFPAWTLSVGGWNILHLNCFHCRVPLVEPSQSRLTLIYISILCFYVNSIIT